MSLTDKYTVKSKFQERAVNFFIKSLLFTPELSMYEPLERVKSKKAMKVSKINAEKSCRD